MTPPPELAPSEVRPDSPSLARVVGLAALFPLVLGTATAVMAERGGTPWLPLGLAYVFVAVGIAGLLIHAVRDTDPEFRRAYGALAGGLLVLAVVFSLLPGRADTVSERQFAYYLLPWGFGFGILSLLFFVPFVRNEDDPAVRGPSLLVLLAAGAVFAVAAVTTGLYRPETLTGPGVALLALGLGFLAAYLSEAGGDDGLGRGVAVTTAVLGAGLVAFAVGRSALPQVLFDGPAGLKNAFQVTDKWKLGGRVATVLGFVLAAGLLGRNRNVPVWVRAGAGAVLLAFAAAFGTATFANPVAVPPEPYLVPNGLILAAAGLLFFALGVGAASDSQFVVLTKRELAAFFYSPVAYFVLFGMTVLQWVGFIIWVLAVLSQGLAAAPVQEPILAEYINGTLIGPLVLIMFVPVLTMRVFSEEKRSGTMEVLLTAPVNETQIVLSKWLATWVFYMLNWVPMGLFLIALRVEGGRPFDVKPLFGLYLAVAVSGAAFVAVGLFFSSITKNQIVAAALTGAAILALFMASWAPRLLTAEGLGRSAGQVLGQLSYWRLWQTSLSGQLLLADLLVQASLAGFFLFATVKVLDARKWS